MTSYLTKMVLHLTYNINPSYLLGLHQKRVIPNKYLFFYLFFIHFLLNRCKALPCPPLHNKRSDKSGVSHHRITMSARNAYLRKIDL